MIYVDTSVLVPLIVNEPDSAIVADWYGHAKDDLVSAVWCVTEFSSALGIKQRTGQLDAAQAATAWGLFNRLVANDLQLLPLRATHFHRAATLTLDAAAALRAGDALHLACAEQAGAKTLATLDQAMGRNARRLGLRIVLDGN